MDRDKIIKFCEEYLEVEKFKDGCYNGLQIDGKHDIKKIITGVTFSEKLIKKAIKKKADMIMTHHGLFAPHFGSAPRINNFLKKRLKLMLDFDINLAGFHLPLDAHSEIGNNISLIKLLGLKKTGVINSPEYGDIGFLGELKKEMLLSEFVKLVDEKLETKSYIVDSGKRVKKIGIISGGAQNDWINAFKLGADTYITGEISEYNVEEVRESGINFIKAGHYNTEKLGIQNLGELVAKKFGVEVEFVDIPCEI